MKEEKNNLPLGEELQNDTQRRCRQVDCAFFKDGGCKPCIACKAEPYILTKNCKRCFACATIPNNLRWDDKNLEQANELAKALFQPEQPIPQPKQKEREIVILKNV